MKSFPAYPAVADAPPELLAQGHVWLHERVDAAPFRFQPLADGRLRFGDEVRTFGDLPAEYDHVVRHLRERFDRDALRAAVDDVESVVFFGYAMHRRGVDYDWETTPNFLGSDVWADTRDAYVLPDRAAKIYDRLGLDSLPVVQAEVRATDFDPGAYQFPDSHYRDGPVAGVLIRNKTGGRARLDNPAIGTDGSSTDIDDGAAFARRHATTERFDAVATQLQREGRTVTFDTLYERTVETLSRAHHRRLFGGDVDVRAFRSTVAELTGAHLARD